MRSTALGERGTSSLGPWRAAWTALPYQGQAPGGDRFLLARSPTGDLCFVLADAAGHGTLGNALWLRHEATFLAAWRAFVAGCSLADFVDPLDASLCAGEALDSVCLTVGRWQPSGALELSTCGYGTHALVRTAQGPWWAEPEALFGLKLGWFGPERRRELPRGLVQTRLSEV